MRPEAPAYPLGPLPTGIPNVAPTAFEAKLEKPPELDFVIGFDLETSGLDEQKNQVLEVAAVFMSIRGGAIVEHGRFQAVLPLITDINDWHPEVLKMHTANGLLAEAVEMRRKALGTPPVGKATEHTRLAEWFDGVDYTLSTRAAARPKEARWALFGNTVHFDLRFARRVFPKFAAHLSHRVFDCSSNRLFCEALGRPHVKGEPAHRAMADVEQSIELYVACRNWCREALPRFEFLQFERTANGQ